MKRDEFLSADDRFMWTMDTFLNQQTGYFFEMNPVGPDGRRAEGRRAAPTPASGTASGTPGRARARSAGCSRSISRSAAWPSIPTRRPGASTSSAPCAASRRSCCGPATSATRACSAWPTPGCWSASPTSAPGAASSCGPTWPDMPPTAPGRVSELGNDDRRRRRPRRGLQPHAEPARGGHHQHRLRRDRGRSAAGQPDPVPAVPARDAAPSSSTARPSSTSRSTASSRAGSG